jgi:hypothetical protein
MLNVPEAPRQQIVRRHNRITLAQQPIAQMRSQETCPSGYERALLVRGSHIHRFQARSRVFNRVPAGISSANAAGRPTL